MADVKITGLPAATVPLSGTELFEVVQTGSSAKVAATAIANTANNVRTVPTGGTGIAYSSTVVSIPKSTDGGKTFFQIVFYEQVTAGQYIEVYWLPASTSVTMEYIAATATALATPAIILSAERIA